MRWVAAINLKTWTPKWLCSSHFIQEVKSNDPLTRTLKGSAMRHKEGRRQKADKQHHDDEVPCGCVCDDRCACHSWKFKLLGRTRMMTMETILLASVFMALLVTTTLLAFSNGVTNIGEPGDEAKDC